MDIELPQSSPQVETPHSIKPKLFIAAAILLVVILGVGAFIFISGLKSTSTSQPETKASQQSTQVEASQSYQSAYLGKAVSVRTPQGFDFNSLIISGDRLNGIIIKVSDSHHFLVESRDDNLADQIIPVVTDSQTVFYLSKPSPTPPDGPFSGIKLPGDYSSSIKNLTLYTIQFQVIPQATDSASLPWVKDNNGSYIAKAVLLDEK